MALIIAEELLLLSHGDDGKELTKSIAGTRGVAGALLIELTLDGRVDVVDGRVVAVEPPVAAGASHPELDALLDRVRTQTKPHKPKWWVQKAESHGVNKQLLSGLADKGILSEEQHRILGLIPGTRWPERDPGPEREIRQRLTAAMEGGAADDRTCALIALVDACGLSRKLFPDMDRGARKARMKELSEGEWAADAVRDAIRSVQAATTAAIVASTNAAGNS